MSAEAKAAAVGYLRGGWSPIPVKGRSKQTSLTELAPYLRRRATGDEISSWSWPGMGIVTGPRCPASWSSTWTGRRARRC